MSAWDSMMAGMHRHPLDADRRRGNLQLDEFERPRSDQTKMVAITQLSNVPGT
jgi:selenocysteine lyase/cysteine desulfurase